MAGDGSRVEKLFFTQLSVPLKSIHPSASAPFPLDGPRSLLSSLCLLIEPPSSGMPLSSSPSSGPSTQHHKVCSQLWEWLVPSSGFPLHLVWSSIVTSLLGIGVCPNLFNNWDPPDDQHCCGSPSGLSTVRCTQQELRLWAEQSCLPDDTRHRRQIVPRLASRFGNRIHDKLWKHKKGISGDVFLCHGWNHQSRLYTIAKTSSQSINNPLKRITKL